LTARWHEGAVQGVCEPGIRLGDGAQAHPYQLTSAPEQVARRHGVAGEPRGQGTVEIEPHGIGDPRASHKAADRRLITARVDVHADDAEAGRGIPALQAAEDGNLDTARETPDRPDVHEDDLAVHGTERYGGAAERDGGGVGLSGASRRSSVAAPAPGDCRDPQHHGHDARQGAPPQRHHEPSTWPALAAHVAEPAGSPYRVRRVRFTSSTLTISTPTRPPSGAKAFWWRMPVISARSAA